MTRPTNKELKIRNLLSTTIERQVLEMAQVTIYIDNETEHKMKNLIKKSGVSKSKWITNLIREKTADTWPDTVRELAGSWPDFPSAEKLRKNQGADSDRESL